MNILPLAFVKKSEMEQNPKIDIHPNHEFYFDGFKD